MNAAHFGGAQCALDEELLVVGEVDNVNVFVVQFAHDAMNTRALHAHASAYGVNAVVVALHGNLGALARDACDAAHLNEAVGDFGNFGFQKAAQEFG